MKPTLGNFACAGNAQRTGEPAITLKKSRRFMGANAQEGVIPAHTSQGSELNLVSTDHQHLPCPFWSKTVLAAPKRHFRSTSNNGHHQTSSACRNVPKAEVIRPRNHVR